MRLKFNPGINRFVLAVTLMTIAALNDQNPLAAAEYNVEVVRTTYGIPHITAKDYGSLGYGEGYAAAQDHVCNIADAIITARGEQALYFGRGKKNAHVISDAVIRALGFPARSQELLEQTPGDIQEWLTGYAAGFNRYLKESEITSWCKGGDFVREITATDLLCRMLTASQTLPRIASMIAAAQPPGKSNPGGGGI